jgi:hypothetical protein
MVTPHIGQILFGGWPSRRLPPKRVADISGLLRFVVRIEIAPHQRHREDRECENDATKNHDVAGRHEPAP